MIGVQCIENESAVCKVESCNKYDAIKEVIRKTPVFKTINRCSCFENAVLQREKEQTTGFGEGIAVAHGQLKEADSVYVALGISEKGIDYDSFDKSPVHILFVVASSPENQTNYLIALSAIVKIAKDEHFKKFLIECNNEKQIFSRFREMFYKITDTTVSA